MKHPDKSFTHNGKKYRRVVIGNTSCSGCAFLYEDGCTARAGTTNSIGKKSHACMHFNNSDNEWSIWVEVKKREKQP